jgi:hypothetical protein
MAGREFDTGVLFSLQVCVIINKIGEGVCR